MGAHNRRPKGFITGDGPGNKGRFGNGPPDFDWIWLTAEMLQSAAWRAMPINARRFVDRVIIEHIAHAGRLNGELVVTYDNLVEYGIRRHAAAEAIEIAVALGWVDRTARGGRSYGGVKRPASYALTWLPRSDGSAKTNRWKMVDDTAAARLLAAVRAERTARNTPIPSQDIYRGVESVTRGKRQSSAKPNLSLVSKASPGMVTEVSPGPVSKVSPGKSFEEGAA